MSGVVSPTPTLIAMNDRPQTIANAQRREDVASGHAAIRRARSPRRRLQRQAILKSCLGANTPGDVMKRP